MPDRNTLLFHHNALTRPNFIKPGSIHCVAFSPPYFSVRDYGVDGQIGYEDLHDCLAWAKGAGPCGMCYICKMRTVMEHVRYVLHDTGTVWIVVGDTYVRDPSKGVKFQAGPKTYDESLNRQASELNTGAPLQLGMNPKNLYGIPHRLFLAFQADGWYMRAIAPWIKKNALPNSAHDRPNIAHEYVLFMSKSERYYYDRYAVLQKGSLVTIQRERRGRSNQHKNNQGAPGQTKQTLMNQQPNTNTRHRGVIKGQEVPLRNRRTSDWFFESLDETILEQELWLEHLRSVKENGGMLVDIEGMVTGFQVNPTGYKGSHYATWPIGLVSPMLAASTSEQGACPNCGNQWQRIVETSTKPRRDNPNPVLEYSAGTGHTHGSAESTTLHKVVTSITTDWRPTCTCNKKGIEFRPDDMELIRSPVGVLPAKDLSEKVGRAGFSRPVADDEGTLSITRFEQRHYAKQLKSSPHRKEMQEEVSETTFAHYIRTDRTGARAPRAGDLAKWLARGWVEPVQIPDFEPLDPVRPAVLDPFVGSGTTLIVTRQLNLMGIGMDISRKYLLEDAMKRLGRRKLERFEGGKAAMAKDEDYSELPLLKGV